MKHGTEILRLLFVATLCATVGCTTSDDILDKIDEAERIAEQKPEEALSIMRSIERRKIRGDKDFARYALVFSEAGYYNRTTCDNDSLVAPMAEYFRESNDHTQRARAMYQHAMVMYAAGKMPEAMHSLMLAEESCHEIDNPRLEGLVHRNKAYIYSDGYLFKNAYKSHKQSRECFERANLTEHSAYAALDMGTTLLHTRKYNEAEPLLIEAHDYATASDNHWLLCEVLHRLCELYAQVEQIDKCEHCLDEFEAYDCLLQDFGHYYCIKAICTAYRGDEAEAHRLIAYAEQQDDAIVEEVEYARYVVYRTFDDTANALMWHELNKHSQDSAMLEVLEQPILNVQVELLQRKLDSERRERELRHQRNIMSFSAIGVLLLLVISYIWYRMRRKNRDIAQYVETIKELQLANRNLPDEMNASIGALYRDRFSELNELCDIYYDHSGSSRQKTLVYDKLRSTITAIKNDKARLTDIEEAVNRYRGNIMKELKTALPKLSERDMRVAIYSFAGFSNRAIALFIDSDPITVSKLKYNLKYKIKKMEVENGDKFISALSEK